MVETQERQDIRKWEEVMVLGSMLRDNSIIDDLAQVLREDHFYWAHHRDIFAEILALHRADVPVDLTTLANALDRKNKIENIGGHHYLGELWTAAPTAANADHYARLVRERALFRALAHIGHEIQREAQNPTGPVEEALENAEKKIFSLLQTGNQGEAVHISAVLNEAVDMLGSRCEGIATGAIKTGLIDLDRKIGGGFHDSELVILAARPGLGKTALALALCRNAAKDNSPVFLVSIEQRRTELGERLLSCDGPIVGNKMRKGQLDGSDWDKIVDSKHRLSKYPIWIKDYAHQNMLGIAGDARRLKTKHGIKMIVIDYLQLVQPENTSVNRQEQVAGISRRMKLLAKELDVPVIALSQLNRSLEERQGGRPRLSDLRESGAIEADADCVLLMHHPEASSNVVEIIVAKQRNGPTGEVKVVFQKEFMRFENYLAGAEWPGTID
jgi:replicative DNA helicase